MVTLPPLHALLVLLDAQLVQDRTAINVRHVVMDSIWSVVTLAKWAVIQVTS